MKGGKGGRGGNGGNRRSTALTALTAFTALTASLHAQDAPSALRRAENAYRTLTSLRAEFRQVITNPMLGGPETSTGTLFLLKPDRFAMRFAEPEGDRLVADGEWLWAYTPSTVPGQVIRQPVPRFGAATPNLFAQFVDRPLERYTATYVGRDTVAGDEVDMVRLVPNADNLGFRQATIGISTATGMLRRVNLIEDSGQRRRLELLRIESDAEVPAAEVTFTVPRGVRVVTP